MAEPAPSPKDLERIASRVRSCTLCRLHVGRTHAVPGEGPPRAVVLLVGEAPGRAEDASGRPFAGAAGKVLDAAFASVRAPRTRFFVTNVVKCRPPSNRRPRADEMVACRPYLLAEIRTVHPRVLVTLGSTALRALIGPSADLRELRGKVLTLGSTPLVPTYHPAAILYNRGLRAALHRDLRKAVRLARRRRKADPVGRKKGSRAGRPDPFSGGS